MPRTSKLVVLYFSLFALAGIARATEVPLYTIKPGTESVTLVPNGNFESPGTQTAGVYQNPTSWTQLDSGSVKAFVAAPVDPPSPTSMGNFSEQANLPNAYDGFSQNISLLANTNYVLSGYLYNFLPTGIGASANVNVDVYTPSTDSILRLTVHNADVGASTGEFIYGTFNSGTNSGFEIRAFMDSVSGSYGGLVGQWDNLAVTLASNFVAPQPTPEPTSLALLGLGGAGLCLAARRRYHRNATSAEQCARQQS